MQHTFVPVQFLSGLTPFADLAAAAGTDDTRYRNLILREVYVNRLRPEPGQLPADVPQDVKDIIVRAWDHDPAARPTMAQFAEVIARHSDEYVTAPIGFGKDVRTDDILGPSSVIIGGAGGGGKAKELTRTFDHASGVAKELLASVIVHEEPSPGVTHTPNVLDSIRAGRAAAAAVPSTAVFADSDVLFLMDCTGSMKEWMSTAQEKIVAIVDDIKGDKTAGIVRVGFVGYRDYSDGDDRIVALPLSHEAERFKEFVSKQEAKGGGDYPEDMAGGLRMALRDEMHWKSHTKVIVHLADAPPHGLQYQDPKHHKAMGDKYPDGENNSSIGTK
jgi:hypothetical protein